jgi:methionine synthase I (cobalamin-dependent)
VKSNAAIKFETTTHSFGNVIEGQIATYDFKFTNIGTDPLILTNVTASCGCTTPKWPREALAPGQSAVITAEYNSNGRPGTFNKNIFVKGNGGDVTLTISGNVIKEPEKPRFVAGSIGPGTKLATLGNVHFDELKNSYLDQVQGLIDGGVDVILIETCQDPLQIKAVLVACYEIFSKIEEEFKDKTDAELLEAYPRGEITKVQEFEASSDRTTITKNQIRTRTGLSKRFRLPLQVQITIEQTGTMLVGTDLNAALTTIAAYPIDIFGMNCATGPKEMQEHIQYLKDNCPVKISCLPNAGIPENVCGHAHFPLGPDEFTSYLSKFSYFTKFEMKKTAE